MGLGEAVVGGRGELEPAAEGDAVEHGDHRLAQPRPAVEDAVPLADPATPELQRPELTPLGDVGTGAEGLGAVAGQDDHAAGVVALDLVGRCGEAVEHGTGRAR